MLPKSQSYTRNHQIGEKVPLSLANQTNSVLDKSETKDMINCSVCGKPIRADQGIMDKIVLDGTGGKVFVHATVHSWCV